ncbi:XRE family transcriptional regulator [Kitasatospora sp. RB6PN24]|uniref:XRE family transcriptional regulator n=1 Tax=Kitasatospora humi TaxID=2893891 RepID=UPI001E4A3490|nr:XRE family transcriptional regulator [Kitasatospora humi]MCC9309287.1 XRE family transcriptional regulator [Kitasatospora humi]
MTDGAGTAREAAPVTLAEKIDYLFTHTTPPGEKVPSNEEVATAINIRAGERAISTPYLWQLRTGRRDNPTKRHLELIAQHFGVSPAFFFDQTVAEEVIQQLRFLHSMASGDVRGVAMRAAGLSAEHLAELNKVIAELTELQALEDEE